MATIDPRPHARARWRDTLAAYGFALPALAFYVYFLVQPVAQSVWISTFDWDGITTATSVGLANYADVIDDPLIREAVIHSLAFIVFYAVVPIVLALVIVGIISRITVRGLTFFRAALFVPYILSSVVVAIAWRWIYAENGPLNQMLGAVGLASWARAWLGDFGSALPSVGLIGSWVMFGLAFVLFVAGVQRIPTELYEAAEVDGAGPIREFFAVTLPSIRGEIRVALVLMITAALRNFDIVWNTTSGGPGTSTTVPSYYVYREAFLTHGVGRASALSVLLTLLILAVLGAVMWLADPSRSLRLRRDAR
ncbi:MAG: carbohydrate ABC transporter permease [Nostocoides sp.]